MISQSVLCVCFSLSLCCSCVRRCFLSSLSCSVCPPLSRGSYRPKESSIVRYRRNVWSALSCSPLICGPVPNVDLSPHGPCAITCTHKIRKLHFCPCPSLSQIICFGVLYPYLFICFLCCLQYQQAAVPFIFLSVTPFRASILQDQQSAGELPLCK